MRVYLSMLIAFMAAGPALAGAAYDAVSGRSEAEQFRVFATVVRSAGERCRVVSRIFYLGDSDGAGYWTVRCDSGDFNVAVANDGGMSTRVVACAVAEAAGARCWRPF